MLAKFQNFYSWRLYSLLIVNISSKLFLLKSLKRSDFSSSIICRWLNNYIPLYFHFRHHSLFTCVVYLETLLSFYFLFLIYFVLAMQLIMCWNEIMEMKWNYQCYIIYPKIAGHFSYIYIHIIQIYYFYYNSRWNDKRNAFRKKYNFILKYIKITYLNWVKII